MQFNLRLQAQNMFAGARQRVHTLSGLCRLKLRSMLQIACVLCHPILTRIFLFVRSIAVSLQELFALK